MASKNNLISLTLLSCFSLTMSSLISASPEIRPIQGTALQDLQHQMETLINQAQEEGTVRVIVELKPETMDMPSMEALFPDAYADLVTDIQEKIFEQFEQAEDLWAFKSVPMFSGKLNAKDLAMLAHSPNINAIHEDRLNALNLDESVSHIGGHTLHDLGYSGAGQTVAILDTGIDRTHPDFGTRIVAEACFSTNDNKEGFTSSCPFNSRSASGYGSAGPCEAENCDHGTHVAGIAAGRYGVAKDANIISVQVFSEIYDDSQCSQYGYSSPCILTLTSDLIRGLEYVYELRHDYQIAAVNLSIGGGYAEETCNDDLRTAIIDKLTAENIAVIAASGNESFTDGMGAPACISSAISVGATDLSDTVADFSNSGAQLDLLAPGVNILSSISSDSRGRKSGTSMAAPHVAGAFAVLKSKVPDSSIADVYQALRETGVRVEDYRNGLVRPRIQIDAAIDRLIESENDDGEKVSDGIALLAPASSTDSAKPHFIWSPVSQADSYFVTILDELDNVVIQGGISAQTAGCSVHGDCSATIAQPLARKASYRWWVEAYDSYGNFVTSSQPGQFYITP